MLNIFPSAQPSLFSRIFKMHSTPSSMNVKLRFCAPPSTSIIGLPFIMLCANCVSTRDDPSFGAVMSSSFGPMKLNGLNRVNFNPSCFPYAHITRSSICFMQEYIHLSFAIGPSTSGDSYSSNCLSGHIP